MTSTLVHMSDLVTMLIPSILSLLLSLLKRFHSSSPSWLIGLLSYHANHPARSPQSFILCMVQVVALCSSHMKQFTSNSCSVVSSLLSLSTLPLFVTCSFPNPIDRNLPNGWTIFWNVPFISFEWFLFPGTFRSFPPLSSVWCKPLTITRYLWLNPDTLLLLWGRTSAPINCR